MRVIVLGSGSCGNSLLVCGSSSNLLVDAGIPLRTMRARLEECVGPGELQIDGIVVTHAHRDHSAHARRYAKHFDAPIYATEATHRSAVMRDVPGVRQIGQGAAFSVGSIRVRPTPVPHDAPQIALVLEDGPQRLGIATDLGHVPPGLAAHLAGCQRLLLESNHDRALLQSGPYPEPLKRRVAGKLGHLDNEAASELLRSLAVDLEQVVLMHISAHNNTPSLAHEAARAALPRHVSVEVASQDRPIVLSPRQCVQMSLAFPTPPPAR